ncbi:MAG: hypothetical protein DRI33_03775, partial [Caldiserica bacterium]
SFSRQIWRPYIRSKRQVTVNHISSKCVSYKNIKFLTIEKTVSFNEKIEDKATICPTCGKPAGNRKFCINCGAPLRMIKCPKYGAENPRGTNFCGNCGTKLG